MPQTLRALSLSTLTCALFLLPACGGNHGGPGGGMTDPQPGQTDFTTAAANQGGRGPGAAEQTTAGGAGAAADSKGAPAPGAPGGRVADVQEADIYRVDHNRLFYLNTYRGFVAYDVSDAQHPTRLGRLPVYGYPVEMFVKGNTVYALLRDVLYLTQVDGVLQFQRRNVSQLVTIDVTNPAHPQLLKAIDIVGELAEGVSRKIDDTIYVVSSIPQWYWYGWQAPGASAPKEQAWVYSFNVADAQNPQLVQKLQVFEGGSVQYNDKGTSYNRWFQNVTIAATSNALMVVENWSVSVWQDPTKLGGVSIGSSCGSYEDNQLAVVSVIDVSDPTGVIRTHAKFQTTGRLSDQFKQTYVFDPVAKTGTYYGIFARQVWSSSGCAGQVSTQNTMESWEVTNGASPVRLSRLDFGKDQETVRGTAFDVDRQVAYAITARNVDPLYAISFADRANLKVLSAIDGLSGDMTVFRTIGDKNGFLLGIGRDNSGTCTGFGGGTTGPVATNIAVSIIDVRDLNKIQLVQRQCVAVQNAEWVGSDLTWNLDQAHKMIGMYSDATANVITVPVYYWKKNDDKSDPYGWWYQWQTAVGIMSWDLGAYDPTKPATAQSVLKNFGTFIHPNGQVLRSIVFTHEGTTPERMMINLSDTHISVASLKDLANPTLQSVVEVAPYATAVLRFGGYVVEEIQSQPYYGWSPNQERTEFRVKAAGGELDDKPALASFTVGQVVRVFKHGDNQLVAIRYIQQPPTDKQQQWQPPVIEAQVYDLTDPTHPRAAGKATLPQDIQLYYGYWCGDWFWGAYGFYGSMNNIIDTAAGLVILGQSWQDNAQTTRLISLDLTQPDAPAVSAKVIATVTNTANWWESDYGLVADPVDPRGFFLTSRQHVGQTKVGELTLELFKDYAQRWEAAGAHWTAGASINLPGRLTKTYLDGKGDRMFVAQDYRWFWVPAAATDQSGHGDSTLRLSLLRQVSVGGRPAASLLDVKAFDSIYPSSMVLEDGKLMLIGHKQGYGYYYPGGGIGVTRAGSGSAGGGAATTASALSSPTPVTDDLSDRLMTFDLSSGKFAAQYDGATGMYNSDLVGLHAGRLLVNLQGDGFLVVDVSDPSAPRGVRFVRTLGWASTVEFAGDDVYVASGYFGVQHFGVGDAPSLVTSN